MCFIQKISCENIFLEEMEESEDIAFMKKVWYLNLIGALLLCCYHKLGQPADFI